MPNYLLEKKRARDFIEAFLNVWISSDNRTLWLRKSEAGKWYIDKF